MNLQEFAALKVGDQVENAAAQSGVGAVTETSDFGVRVRWGSNGTAQTFFYNVQGTAWFHWSKVEPEKDCPGLDKCTNERCRKSEQCLGGSKADYNKWAGSKVPPQEPNPK